jgi:glyoxylase-like metal-dependent hydrolase (beta-lactamase superfamily II)
MRELTPLSTRACPAIGPHIIGFLASWNAPLTAVKAVVLTHRHPDHTGNAERLRARAGATVLVRHDDLAASMRKAGKPPAFPLWKPNR